MAVQLDSGLPLREVSILVVDDDDGYRLVLQHVITKLGRNTSIHEAGSGREALEFLKAQKVDIIVLDYEMPDMKGTDVLTALKELGVIKTAIGLTRYGEPVLSNMVDSCAIEAFCKDDREEFSRFLQCRIDDLGARV